MFISWDYLIGNLEIVDNKYVFIIISFKVVISGSFYFLGEFWVFLVIGRFFLVGVLEIRFLNNLW